MHNIDNPLIHIRYRQYHLRVAPSSISISVDNTQKHTIPPFQIYRFLQWGLPA